MFCQANEINNNFSLNVLHVEQRHIYIGSITRFVQYIIYCTNYIIIDFYAKRNTENY